MAGVLVGKAQKAYDLLIKRNYHQAFNYETVKEVILAAYKNSDQTSNFPNEKQRLPDKSCSSSKAFQKSTSQSSSRSNIVCRYCKKRGHLISDCLKLQRKEQRASKPNGFVISRQVDAVQLTSTVSDDDTVSQTVDCAKQCSDPEMDSVQPCSSDGFVLPAGDFETAEPINVHSNAVLMTSDTVVHRGGVVESLPLDLSDSWLCQDMNFVDRSCDVVDESLQRDLSDLWLCQVMDFDSTESESPVSTPSSIPCDLIKQQKADTDITLWFQKAMTSAEAEKEVTCFYTKDGVLMRKGRPPDITDDDTGTIQHQIVVPSSYRKSIVQRAHEVSVQEHLSEHEIYCKILKNFYWLNLKSDVSEFFKSCHLCQVMGQSSKDIPKTRVQPPVDCCDQELIGGSVVTNSTPQTEAEEKDDVADVSVGANVFNLLQTIDLRLQFTIPDSKDFFKNILDVPTMKDNHNFDVSDVKSMKN